MSSTETPTQLELKHLAVYLPYGLKVENLNYKKDYVGVRYSILKQLQQHTDYCTYKTDADNIGGLGDVKPILRPLSDLIDRNLIAILCKKAIVSIWVYETFDFIIKSYHQEERNYGIVAQSDDYRVGFSVSFSNQQDIKLTLSNIPNYEGDMMLNKLELFEWLFAEYFDVYGLIDAGLAVNINTLDIQP